MHVPCFPSQRLILDLILKIPENMRFFATYSSISYTVVERIRGICINTKYIKENYRKCNNPNLGKLSVIDRTILNVNNLGIILKRRQL